MKICGGCKRWISIVNCKKKYIHSMIARSMSNLGFRIYENFLSICGGTCQRTGFIIAFRYTA